MMIQGSPREVGEFLRGQGWRASPVDVTIIENPMMFYWHPVATYFYTIWPNSTTKYTLLDWKPCDGMAYARIKAAFEAIPPCQN